MSQAISAMITELEHEAASTRRLLERVPEEKLSWKPHEKSMSLGQLSLHVASLPGAIANLLTKNGLDVATANFRPAEAKSRGELLEALERSLANAREVLGGLNDQQAMETWKMTKGDKEVFAIPKVAMVRTILLNHWYHHRGQLTVYLRLLDVSLPSVYGPSADESIF